MADVPQHSDLPEEAMKTILLVEDDADIGEFLVAALRAEQRYQTLLATNESQA